MGDIGKSLHEIAVQLKRLVDFVEKENVTLHIERKKKKE